MGLLPRLAKQGVNHIGSKPGLPVVHLMRSGNQTGARILLKFRAPSKENGRMKSLLQCMVLILAAWLTVASEAAGLAPVKATPPNFVVLILDDWGWDASGAYGNPNIHTPHIDQLARLHLDV